MTPAQQAGLNRPSAGDTLRQIQTADRNRDLLLRPIKPINDSDPTRFARLKQIKAER